VVVVDESLIAVLEPVSVIFMMVVTDAVLVSVVVDVVAFTVLDI